MTTMRSVLVYEMTAMSLVLMIVCPNLSVFFSYVITLILVGIYILSTSFSSRVDLSYTNTYSVLELSIYGTVTIAV